MFDERRKKTWPLFKTGLKERHENVWTTMGASVVAGYHASVVTSSTQGAHFVS